MRVGASLERHVAAHGLGEAYAATGFHLGVDADTVLTLDVAFTRRERLDRVDDDEESFPGTPDLAIEVVSLGDAYDAVHGKMLDLLDAGCSMVVIMNPKCRAATVYRSHSDVLVLSENDVLDGGDVVPGWKLPLRELFD